MFFYQTQDSCFKSRDKSTFISHASKTHATTCDNCDRFAQNEFEHGSVERGRSVFEGLMASYPKRLDLWNVYVDKEIKAGDVRAARNLLERLVRRGKI